MHDVSAPIDLSSIYSGILIDLLIKRDVTTSCQLSGHFSAHTWSYQGYSRLLKLLCVVTVPLTLIVR